MRDRYARFGAIALLLACLLSGFLTACARSVNHAMVVPAPPPPPPPPPPPQPDEQLAGGGGYSLPVGPSTKKFRRVAVRRAVQPDVPASAQPAPQLVTAGLSDRVEIPIVSASLRPLAQPNVDPRDSQIDDQVKQFREYEVLFNQPTRLPFQKPTLIRLVIAAKDRDAAMADLAASTGSIESDRVKLSRQVRAELTGPGDDVKIEAVGNSTRDVIGAANTTFDWYVTPQTTSDFKLVLRLYNRVYDGKDWIEVQAQPWVKEFQVSVTATQKAELLVGKLNAWLALVGSSLAALVGLAIAKFKARFSAQKQGEGNAKA